MKKLETGMILHCASDGVFGSIIKLATAPIRFIKGEWVSKHTAILAQDDGVLWVYESTSFKGAYRIPFEQWKKKHKDFRITPIEISPKKHALKKALNSYLGRDYEPWWSLVLVPFNKAKKSSKRLFCTEYIVTALMDIEHYMGLDWGEASKVDPDEFYEALEVTYGIL